MATRNGTAPTLPPHANGGVRGLLKERAYEELKRRLLNNHYPPGSFLAERQLAEQLGMSKTPVKAALERLEHEGFITVSPQQGIVVRELALREIADQYEIRVALETFTVRSVAGKLAPDQVARLKANLKAQDAIRGTNQVARAVELDAEFHTLFAEFLGNQEILRVTMQLREKMQRVITAVFHINAARIDSSYEEHRAIAEAVLRGDGAEAARMAERHLMIGKQFLLAPRHSA
jgi:DNA-binding GntR family transcriptional regulator